MGSGRRRGQEQGVRGGRRKKLIAALRWYHQWGAAVATSVKLIELGREPLPQFFEQPDIPAGDTIYWSAFADLSTERQIGMSIGPIPRSKTRAYATDELDLHGEAHEHFCAVIDLMDAAFVQQANAVKSPNDPQTRSTASPEDGNAVGRILENVAKKPARPKRKTL